MTSPIRKKLIEVSIPLEAIDAEARRRKQKAPKGYPTAIHKYWAQRPVAACRAVLFAQLVDDPSAWPERFPSIESCERERKRLHDLMKRLVLWEASGNNVVLDDARWEIARTLAWGLDSEPPDRNDPSALRNYITLNGPTICDPFCGAGSIPLEAQRLGLKVRASDLNPVAILITKALVDIPRRFTTRAPVNSAFRDAGTQAFLSSMHGARGLAEDIKYYASILNDRAVINLATYYPDIRLGSNTLQPVAYFWVRTVRSPDPSAMGAYVPLASSFLLSRRAGRSTWLRPIVSQDTAGEYQFEVASGIPDPDEEVRIKLGTKAPGRGSEFSCLLTGSPIPGSYIKSEGIAGRLKRRLMAIVVQNGRSRTYAAPTIDQEEIAATASKSAVVQEGREVWLSQPVPERLTGGTCYPYGLTSFDKLYTDRQLIALGTFIRLLPALRSEVMNDAVAAGFNNDDVPLSAGGSGACAYADAIVTCLTLAIGRMALYGSTLCRWLTKDNALGSAIAQKGLEMTWDFCEANFLASSSASLLTCAANVSECLLSWDYGAGEVPTVELEDAKLIRANRGYVWNTDPPYYDNIAYADLSDYFYLWHRWALHEVWPNLYRRLTTNKSDEITALAYRERMPGSANPITWRLLDPKGKAEAFFMDGIAGAFANMKSGELSRYPSVIYYAFRQHDESEIGITSAGWASILQAIVDAGFTIDGTWPLRTELTAALKTNVNALASSIVLVCRQLSANASVVTRADFIRALRRELPGAIDNIRKAGVGPVDMQQSIIGPGMGVFTRYTRVLEDDDSAMGVKTALTLINRVWAEIENELDAAFDPATQVALAWFATYGFDAKPSGELIILANAKNIPLEALFSSGVFQNLHGRSGLIPRSELPVGWTPATDKEPTVWECVQHSARVLAAADGGAAAAAALVGQMGRMAADARTLAYRLFEISTQKGWAAEALVYNELAQEWPRLEELGPTDAGSPATPAQRDMFAEAT